MLFDKGSDNFLDIICNSVVNSSFRNFFFHQLMPNFHIDHDINITLNSQGIISYQFFLIIYVNYLNALLSHLQLIYILESYCSLNLRTAHSLVFLFILPINIFITQHWGYKLTLADLEKAARKKWKKERGIISYIYYCNISNL